MKWKSDEGFSLFSVTRAATIWKRSIFFAQKYVWLCMKSQHIYWLKYTVCLTGYVLQVRGWASSPCTRGWCSPTCGGTSTSASRWPWRSSGFSPRQQWRERRPPSTVLWSHSWTARAAGTSGNQQLVMQDFMPLSITTCWLTKGCTEWSWRLTVFIPSSLCNGHSLSSRVPSDCAAARCSRAASDDDSAQKLWEISCNLLGITWEWRVWPAQRRIHRGTGVAVTVAKNVYFINQNTV